MDGCLLPFALLSRRSTFSLEVFTVNLRNDKMLFLLTRLWKKFFGVTVATASSKFIDGRVERWWNLH